MKKILVCCCLAFQSLATAYGQELKRLYYNKDWEVEKSPAKAAYYCSWAKGENDNLIMYGFTIAGKSVFTGYSYDINANIAVQKQGRFWFFDKDGSLAATGDYQKGVPTGKWIFYHPGGQKAAAVVNYINGQIQNRTEYDTSGKVCMELDIATATEVCYRDGLPYRRVYMRGNDRVVVTGTDSATHNFLPPDPLKKPKNAAPPLPGWVQLSSTAWPYVDEVRNEMMDNIGRTLRYPSDAREGGIKGMVIVGYDLQSDGSITGAYVASSSHPILDDAAIRVFQNSDRHELPKVNADYPVHLFQPVRFTLE